MPVIIRALPYSDDGFTNQIGVEMNDLIGHLAYFKLRGGFCDEGRGKYAAAPASRKQKSYFKSLF